MATLSPAAAVHAVPEVLLGGFDLAIGPQRKKVLLPLGEIHLLSEEPFRGGRAFRPAAGALVALRCGLARPRRAGDHDRW